MSGYKGPERRIHKVFVTQNTEYHLKAGICVAVRDLKTGEWLDSHKALRKRVVGSIKFLSNGGLIPKLGLPEPGECIYFDCDGNDLITTPVKEIKRPPKELVMRYYKI